jgi:hypothetical protein
LRKKQREEGGETMAEEKKNQPVSSAQTTQPVSTAQPQPVSSAQTEQNTEIETLKKENRKFESKNCFLTE